MDVNINFERHFQEKSKRDQEDVAFKNAHNFYDFSKELSKLDYDIRTSVEIKPILS